MAIDFIPINWRKILITPTKAVISRMSVSGQKRTWASYRSLVDTFPNCFRFSADGGVRRGPSEFITNDRDKPFGVDAFLVRKSIAFDVEDERLF